MHLAVFGQQYLEKKLGSYRMHPLHPYKARASTLSASSQYLISIP